MRKDHSLVAGLVTRLAAGTGAALIAAGLLAEAAIADPDMIAAKINQVGGKTLQALTAKRNDETVIVSPYGLGTALHLLMLGAAQESKAEEALKLSLVPESTKSLDIARTDLAGFNAKVLSVKKADKVTLKSASAVYVPSNNFSDNFEKKAERVLKATVEAIDFKSPGALTTINDWVKEATKGEIPAILEKLEPDARFVLLNAVYFKGAWENAFDPAQTAKGAFTLVSGSKREDVPMMNGSFPTAIADLGDLQAVWLPYAGKDIAMVVIAPRSDGAPTLVADTLKTTAIDKLVEKASKDAQPKTIHVRMPRFRVESFLDITQALAGQIGPALVAEADYSPINAAKSGPLLVVHRASVEVSEAGTVAAAATGITTDRSLQISPVFSVDRPFAFAIVHRATGAILFTGYIADPGVAPEAKGP